MIVLTLGRFFTLTPKMNMLRQLLFYIILLLTQRTYPNLFDAHPPFKSTETSAIQLV